MRIILHPLAETELLEAASFYEDRASGLGQDFILDFERLSPGSRRIPESVLAWERECGEPSFVVFLSAFSFAQLVRTSVSSR